MRPVAALAAVVVVVLTALLVGVPAEAATAGGLRLVLTELSPRVVTSEGPTTLTVTGTLTNDGPLPVGDLEVRVQRGNPLGTEGQIRDALNGDVATDAVAPEFTPVTDALAPGAQVPLRLTVPLRGSASNGLALGATGVDELLVNVNGTPEGGTRARLAAARMLLPVLGLPGADTTRVRSAAPAPLTVLYPIADVPHRLSTVPGAPVLLDDDTLAASFAPSGRLGGLVAALAQQAPLSSPVRSALCLAIDPDLVETASVMSQGYQVLGPNGATAPGTGAAVAGQWLAQLVAVAKGGCVVALPYADADLVALQRGGLTDAASQAIVAGRQILASLLQTPIVTDVAWPADGLIDTTTLDVAEAAGARSMVLSTDSVDGRTRSGVVPLAGRNHPMTALLTDTLLASAATGPTGPPPAPEPGAAATPESVAGNGGPLGTQDLIGALAFRSTSSTPLVLAPPHGWGTEGTGAEQLLDAIGTLITVGNVTPVGLTAAFAATDPAAAAVHADPPVEMSVVSSSAIGTVAAAVRDLADLRTAVVSNAGVGITADQLFAPLDLGVLRPASATRRGSPTDAQSAASAELSRVDAIRNSIRVLEPPNPYSLGSSDAPLPLTIANALPVTVRVRIEVVGTSGLRVAPIEVQQIPPLGRRQVSVNAQVTRAGQFTVEASVRTPAGGVLGPPSRLRVRSTAYGTITGWLTAIAGGLLVLLAGRRIWRRVRGEQQRPTARVDPTPPPTDEPTEQLPLPHTTLRSPRRSLPAAAGARGAGGRAHDPAAPAAALSAPTTVTFPEDPTERLPMVVGPLPRQEDPAPVSSAEPDTTPIPRIRTESIGRSSGLMAVANLVSRITGFLRQVVLVGVLGVGVLNDAYTVSNTLPNIVYELLFGGVLTSVMIPLLVRAQKEDADGGETYIRRLITLAGAALLVGTALAVLAAPLLTRLYLGGQSATASPELATALAYLLLPQILFYGLGALLGAILNTRGSFGAFAWAPVLNNVVVLVVLSVYALLPGEISLDPVRMGEPKLLVLGIGTTLGIVAQAVVLLPALRRAGFTYRPRWGWDPRLSSAGGLVLWVVAYVLIGVPGYMVTTRVAAAADPGGVTVYANAWLLLQVPYGVLGVSLLTALMPRMSRSAADGRLRGVVDDLALGSRLSAVFLVPLSVLLTVFGVQVGVALFGLRSGNLDGAARIGAAVACSAFGLLPYAITMLQLRVFYAMTDSRTPAFIQLFTVAVKIPLLLLCPLLLPAREVVLGLAAANGLSFVAGAVLGQILLRRRLGRIPTLAVASTTGRTLIASLVGALAAALVVAVLPWAGLAPLGRAWAQLVVATVIALPVTFLGLRVLRVTELNPLLRRVERIVDRVKHRRHSAS